MNQLIKRPIQGHGGGGSKGGGGGARTPVEATDTLRSVQFARVLDLISEGEVEGLVDGMKSIFLDDVPIQNADDSFNFTGVSISTVNGTQSQPHIPGFPDTEAETAVGVEVTNAQSVTRTITDATVDALRVTLSVPALTTLNTENGDLSGGVINLEIDLQANGGGFVTVVSDDIIGKTTTTYLRSYRIELTGDAPWDIRVRRTKADSTKSTIQDKFSWSSYTQLVDEKFTYPNSAIVALEVDAAQFNRIPKRSYDFKLLKIKIPNNYDPITRVYDGVWDGTFVTAWTDNPAWAFFDLATDTRYGLGGFLTESQVDKFTLYTISQYCDELVDDGFGGTEPRFTINAYFQSREEAYTVMLNLASVFRGMLYWAGGQLVPVQDKPETAVYQFNDANVEEGLFSYAGTSKAARHTVALVAYNDRNQRDERKVEYVEDSIGITRYGVNETELVALGAASRGQANRVGRWLLLSERLETESVSFIAGLEGTNVFPGSVIDVMDSKRAGVRGGGRILSATTTVIDIDATFTLEAAKTYELQVLLPDGTMEEQTVTTSSGPVTQLTVDTPFTTAPNRNALWVLSTDNLVKQQFRIVSIVEDGKNKHEVLAIAHDPAKFAQIDTGILLSTLPTDVSTAVLPAPENVVIGEFTQQFNNQVTTVMLVSWDTVIGAISYFIKYKKDDDNFTNAVEVVQPSAEFIVPGPGTYTVQVFALSSTGVRSVSTFETAIISGRLDTLRTRVTGLEIVNSGNNNEFTGRDAKFEWRAQTTTNSFELGEEPDGAGSGSLDPFFKDYEVRILKEGNLLRVEHVADSSYIYTFEKNAEDFRLSNNVPGANRTFTIEVYARGIQNQISISKATLTASNPAPPLPGAVNINSALNTIFFESTAPDDLDFAGLKIWLSTSGGFTPGDNNLIYKGPDVGVAIGALVADTEYFLVFASFDSFGDDGLIESAEQSITTGLILQTELGVGIVEAINIATDAVEEAKIKADAVTADKIGPLAVESAAIAADAVIADKIGPLAVEEAAIAANAVSESKIVDLAVAEAKIAASAVTATKIGALAVTNAKIDTAAVTNAKIDNLAVDGAKIATAAITEAKIDALAVTNAKIGALAVDGAKIAALAVTEAKIGALAVTAAKIDSLAVTAAKIDTAAVTSAKIDSLAVTNAKIALLAVDTAQIAALAIEEAKIDALAVTNGKIGLLAVDTAQIAAAAIETAKIDDLAVETIKIKDNAVTIPVSSFVSSGTGTTGSFVTLVTATITSTGQPIAIIFAFHANNSGGGFKIEAKLLRGTTEVVAAKEVNGATIPTNAQWAFVYRDSPTSGTHTYNVQIKHTLGSATISNRSMLLLEVIK
jgi:hypothetical protein